MKTEEEIIEKRNDLLMQMIKIEQTFLYSVSIPDEQAKFLSKRYYDLVMWIDALDWVLVTREKLDE